MVQHGPDVSIPLWEIYTQPRWLNSSGPWIKACGKE